MSVIGLYSLQKFLMVENGLRQMCRFKSKNYKDLDVTTPVFQRYLNYLVFQNETLLLKDQRSTKDLKKLYELKPIVNVLVQKIFYQANIDFLNKQKEHARSDTNKRTITQETELFQKRLADLENRVKSALLDPVLTNSGIVLEIDAHEGEHASQFAQELFNMYKSYAQYKGWTFDVASLDKSDYGGFKHVSLLIEGLGAYELMNLEVGKHHSYVPIEGEDRFTHGSTVTVDVMRIPNNLQFKIPPGDVIIETKEELDLSNTEVQNNSVRVTHIPSDTVIECKQNMSNEINEQIAMKTLTAIIFEVERLCNQADENGEIEDVFEKKQITVRDYDHSLNEVIDSREGEHEKCELKDFLTNGEHLDRLQNSLLRYQRYQAVIKDLGNFTKSISSNADDISETTT